MPSLSPTASLRDLLASVAEPETPEERHEAWNKIERAFAEYEASVMGVLARLPNHWQTYRDPLELGTGIREARRLGREALEAAGRWTCDTSYGPPLGTPAPLPNQPATAGGYYGVEAG